MNKNPKVSVILPSLNVNQYIDECILSVRNQTLRDIEIICVDAGSTDGTLEKIKYHANIDARIRIIISDIKSYGRQMNLGINSAAGDYIGIVETDDYIIPEMYEELYNIATENNVDFIKADFWRFTGKNTSLEKKLYNLSTREDLYDRVLSANEEPTIFYFLLNTWSGIYKRNFLKLYDIKHNETPGASFQDNGFWFQTMIYARRAYFHHKPYYMNRRDNPNSSVFSKDKVYCMCDEYQFIYSKLVNSNLLSQYQYIFSHIALKNYNFTLERIDDKYKYDFLERFANDFKIMHSKGMIDFQLLSPNERKNLLSIISNYKEYWETKYKNKLKFYEEIQRYGQIIIYGAGNIGLRFFQELTSSYSSVKVICFAVSQADNNKNEFKGIPILPIFKLLEYTETVPIVIATSEKYHLEIIKTLDKLNFKNVIFAP